MTIPNLNACRTVLSGLALFATLVLAVAPGQAAKPPKGRELFGPVRVNEGDALQVIFTNAWSTRSSSVAARIFDPAGAVVASVGYGKGTPLPKQLLPAKSEVLEVTCSTTPACDYTAVAELFSSSGGAHAPLLSMQVVKRDGTAGIWGTGGVALDAIWGTGGVAREGIWGTGGVARTGIWGTGGVAWQDTVGAFPAVRVASGQSYRLIAQNPYDDPMTIRISLLLYSGGDVTAEKFKEEQLDAGEVVEFEIFGEGTDVVGLVEVIRSSAAEAGPITTMQLLQGGEPVGIWGTGGVAYEADDRP